MVEIITSDASIPYWMHEEAHNASRTEILQYVAYSVGFRPKSATVSYDKESEEFIVKLEVDKPRIVKIRRITGYLSSLENFGTAKTAEQKDRVKHYKVQTTQET